MLFLFFIDVGRWTVLNKTFRKIQFLYINPLKRLLNVTSFTAEPLLAQINGVGGAKNI